MTVELFTVATRPTAGLARLRTSFSKFGVPVSILGENEEDYWGNGWKWKMFVRAAKSSSADIIVFCDAYDSICLEGLPGMLAKFTSLAHPIIFSYEPQGQPEFWLALNSGLVMAERSALLKVFNDQTLDEFFPDHFNDQFQIQSMYSWDPTAFALDRQGILFHTLGSRSPELILRQNRLVDPDTGNSPSFVHAPQNGDLSKVEQWVSAQA